jgi:transcriptional regulator with XRE-family HTH domain
MAWPGLEEVSLLESLRVDRGLTINAAAHQAGVNVRTVQRYERGLQDRPHGDALEKLARLYNVRASVILDDMRKAHRRRVERENAQAA